MFENQNIKDWRLWWQLFVRRWFILFIISALAGGIGIIIALTTTPEYESSSTLMILDTDLLSGSSLRFVPGAPQRDEIDYFRRRITSVEFLRNMLEHLDYKRKPYVIERVAALAAKSPEIAISEIEEIVSIEYLQKKISTRKRAYNVIELQARGETANEAYTLGKLFTELAITESQKNQVELASFASTFSNQLLENYEQKLNDADRQLKQFERGTLSADNSELDLDPEKLAAIESVLLSLDVEIGIKNETRSELSNELQNISKGYKTQVEDEIRDTKGKILQRTESVCQLFKKFEWKDVEISILNEEIARLQKDIITRIQTTLYNYYPELPSSVTEKLIRLEILEVDISRLQRQKEVYLAIIESHKEYVNSKPTREAYLSRLQGEVDKYKEIYDLLLQQVRGNQIRETAQQQEAQLRFRLLVPPQRPLERVKPKRKRIVLISLFLGGILGISLIYGLETLTTTIKSVEDITEDFGLPVLATIPRLAPISKGYKKSKLKLLLLVAIPIITFVTAFALYNILLR